MIKRLILTIAILSLLLSNTLATTYFYFDAEDEVVGADLPLYTGAPANFCQTACSGVGENGTTQSSGLVPDGSKYFRWEIFKYTGTHTEGTHATILTDAAASWTTNELDGSKLYNSTDSSVGEVLSNTATTATVASLTGGTDNQWENGDAYAISQHDHFTSIESDTMPTEAGWPVTLATSTSYYLAYFMSFAPTGGEDIWERGSAVDSADKGIELTGGDIRIMISRGHWNNYAANGVDCYTLWGSVMKGSNGGISWGQNQSGYTVDNPIQLEYDKWYGIVLEFTLSSNSTGTMIVRVNGDKTEEYTNLNTMESPYSTEVTGLRAGGTMAQSAYNAGAHYRKFDRMILTDVWQDIIDGDYLSDPESGSGSSTGSVLSGITPTGITFR